MVRTSCLAAVLLAAVVLHSHAHAATPARESGRLRWVRGEVTAASAGSLTLKLRGRELTLALDATPSPAVGTVVEAHYTDEHGERRAAFLFGIDRSSALSKRPGTSYRGVIRQIKRGTVSLAAGAKSHGIKLMKKTRLLDAEGRALATGSREVAALLPAGEDVVVKYEDDGGTIMIGDMMMAAGSDQALEIRKLR